jgi:uncharacterized protein YeaO (DUF488 family)
MTTKHSPIRIKRAYDAPARSDGYRILVDRLWPRGLSKVKAKLDEWDKDIAPSPELRVWFGHDPARFAEFNRLYRAELARNPRGVARLRALAAKRPLTLVYAAKDPACNHALVLQALLERKRTPAA